ncbi:MAG: hypothetical protein EON58_12005 [Alphaproteobacteria bacterium]|nr:MAG: hypothetical protein EON58_12005 [Alphaproteobacteria bacterium]
MASFRLSSFVLGGALLLIGCGDDKSPPVDPAAVGPRGALKSADMQEKMQSHTPDQAPAPGTNTK